MSGAAWMVVSISTAIASIVLAVLGFTIFDIESNRFNKDRPPINEDGLHRLWVLYWVDLVVYVALGVACFLNARALPLPLLFMFSIPVAGFGIMIILLRSLFSDI